MELDDTLDELLRWIRPAWHRDSACLEVSGINFFPGQGDDVEPARQVCRGCLVREDCAAAGIAGNEHGIWGALTVLDRRKIRTARRAP